MNFYKRQRSKRKVNGQTGLFDSDEQFKDLVLFYEFFNDDYGKGVDASHQTGWTGVIAEVIRKGRDYFDILDVLDGLSKNTNLER